LSCSLSPIPDSFVLTPRAPVPRPLQQPPTCKVAHERCDAESPGRRAFTRGDLVHEHTQARRRHTHDIITLVREAEALGITIDDRSEHSTEEQDESVRVTMVSDDRMRYQLLGIARDQRHRARALEAKTIFAFDLQTHDAIAHVIERELAVE